MVNVSVMVKMNKTKIQNLSTESMPSWNLYGPMIQQRLREHCGFFLQDHELQTLERAVCQRLKTNHTLTLGEYYGILTQANSPEWKELLNILTIKHTFFFRNQPHFEALRLTVLPELLKQKKQASPYKKPTLSIWSAGCSTGEEPYSIAMLLQDSFNSEDWNIDILATDISEQALDLARRGVYHENLVQSLNNRYTSRFFCRDSSLAEKKCFMIHDDIKKMVRFDYLNLMSPTIPQQMDIIFCRNVMIYFDRPMIQELIQRFEKSLQTPGYLFIGHSESLQGLPHHLQLCHSNEGIFYQTGGPSETTPYHLPRKVSHPKTKRGRIALPTNPIEKPVKKPLEDQLKEIRTAYHNKNYDHALTLSHQVEKDHPDSTEALFYAAQIYLNQRHFNLAAAALQRLLQHNPMYAQGYYLQGILCLEQHDLEHAKQSLRRAVYLEQQFPMAYFTLALAYSQDSNITAAIREYRNALKILMQQTDLETEVNYSGGFTHETLICICHNSIERLKVKHETCSVHA